MSCALRSIGSFSKCVLLFVLALGAPAVAYPQSSVCHTIASGETATEAARRLTGDHLNEYQPWFQIMDEASRFVPKSQYNRVRPGWRACIVKEAVKSSARAVPASQREAIPAPDVPAATVQPAAVEALQPMARVGPMLDWLANTIRPIRAVDLMVVWVAAAVMVPLFAWKILDNYVSRRNAKLIVMKHFARRFVSEFERPLIQQPTEHPVKSLVRLSPVRARVDILLAPGQGRRYPNLSDHRKNVEYDVVRILRVLADDSFVRDPLYTQAGWVVVPFRFRVRRKHRGVV